MIRASVLPILFSLPLLAGCTSAPPFDAEAVVSEWVSYLNQDHVLVPGDQLDVTFSQLNVSQRVVVSAEGAVSLPQLDRPIIGAGKSMAVFRHEIEEAFRRAQRTPGVVSVTLYQPSTKSVYVAGEVENQGPVPWSEQMSLAKAVASAGGTLVTAKHNDVYITRADPVTHKPRSFRANLTDILYGDSMDFPLLPGDVVYVQTSVGGDMAHFVDLWVRRVLPIDSVGGILGVAAFSRTN